MWPVSQDWMDALGGPHDVAWEAVAIRDGRETAQLSLAAPPRISADWDGDKITTNVALSIADPTGRLFSADPLSPLAAEAGQAIRIRAAMTAGAAWTEWVPMGTYRISDSNPGGGLTWALNRDGTWRTLGTLLAPACEDYLAHLAEWDLLSPTTARAGGTVRSEIVRLAGGDLPIGDWAATTSVPAGTLYDASRLGGLVTLARLASSSLWVDRTTTLQLLPNTGVGPAWTIRPDDRTDPVTAGARQQPTLVSMTPQSSRDGIYNAAWTTGETAAGLPVAGSALLTTGPHAWSAPLQGFGRAPYRRHNPLAATVAAARADAATTLARTVRSQMATLTVTAVRNLAMDVLDKVQVVSPGGTWTGIIAALDYEPTQTLTVLVPWEQVWRG